MTRILSYNILVGGTRRIDPIERMIREADPDVVGLVEATNLEVVRELARRLGMEYRTNAAPDGSWKPSIALLSRLPITGSEIHPCSGLITRPLLEVMLEEAHGERLTAFVVHLIASFSDGRGGEHIRRKEVREILRVTQANQGPHFLMGDFNALAPGDSFKASALLGYLLEQEQRRKDRSYDSNGHPTLDGVVPPSLRFLNPFLNQIPRSKLLCAMFDAASSLYAPRGSIRLLRKAGYVDCFRSLHLRERGFTCPAAAPAGRIDYIFANSLLAARLSACAVVEGNDEVRGREASDHLPIMVEFGAGVETPVKPCKDELVEAGETRSEAL